VGFGRVRERERALDLDAQGAALDELCEAREALAVRVDEVVDSPVFITSSPGAHDHCLHRWRKIVWSLISGRACASLGFSNGNRGAGGGRLR
jgi:hypothetical protein